MRTFVSRPLVRVAAALLFAFGLGSCTAADRTPTAASTAASGAPGDLLGLDLNVAGLQLLSCTVTQSYSASKTIGLVRKDQRHCLPSASDALAWASAAPLIVP